MFFYNDRVSFTIREIEIDPVREVEKREEMSIHVAKSESHPTSAATRTTNYLLRRSASTYLYIFIFFIYIKIASSAAPPSFGWYVDKSELEGELHHQLSHAPRKYNKNKRKRKKNSFTDSIHRISGSYSCPPSGSICSQQCIRSQSYIFFRAQDRRDIG